MSASVRDTTIAAVLWAAAAVALAINLTHNSPIAIAAHAVVLLAAIAATVPLAAYSEFRALVVGIIGATPWMAVSLIAELNGLHPADKAAIPAGLAAGALVLYFAVGTRSTATAPTRHTK